MMKRFLASLIAFIIPATLIGGAVWVDNSLYISVSRFVAPSLFLAGIVYIFWPQIQKCFNWLKSKIGSITNVLTKIFEADKFLRLKAEQQKNPAKFLFPVIDLIDINRQGGDVTKNDVFVRFRIESHLLFPISEYYVFVKLCFRDESLSSFPQAKVNAWYEIKQEGNYPPILQLERHRFAEEKLCIEDREDKLLKMIEKARKDRRVSATLKIGIAFRAEEREHPVCLDGSRWIMPMMDYRGE